VIKLGVGQRLVRGEHSRGNLGSFRQSFEIFFNLEPSVP
jgi:hypothetical protein